ncbi:hypothetical protein [Phenylobacterium sp.]|uniref:hypothetical protein n=1 Tax=Phenylobacterium sp. TaxID=1871053 RepID=UPI002FC97A50
MSEARPIIPDPEGLIAALRRRDEGALAQAYRICFGGEIGRFVLASILADAGLGAVRGGDFTGEARAYHDGRLDNALTIMNRAGFDQFSATTTVLDESDQLKGRDDERSSGAFGGPDADPGALNPS